MSALTQAIKENIPILTFAQMCGFHIRKIGREYTLEEHDSVRINAEKNLFVRNSTGEKGTVIDFCMFAQRCDEKFAIKQLRQIMGDKQLPQQTTIHKSFKPKQNIPIDIPKKNPGGYKRMYAYLCKTRCIDSDVVKHLVDRKMLFEDEKHHNCVWLGYDYDNKPKFGCKRVTLDKKYMPKYVLKDVKKSNLDRGIFYNEKTSDLFIANCKIPEKTLSALAEKSVIKKIFLLFDSKKQNVEDKLENIDTIRKLKLNRISFIADTERWLKQKDVSKYKSVNEPYKRGDLLGSKKSVGMFIDNKSSTLFVNEAPIDTMSIMTFFNQDKDFNFNDYSYLAQAGTNGIDSLIYHIQHQPKISKIYLCYDNDEAGKIARQTAREELNKIGYKGIVEDKIPVHNDFNDDLKSHIATQISKQTQKQTQQQNNTKVREIDNQCQLSY